MTVKELKEYLSTKDNDLDIIININNILYEVVDIDNNSLAVEIYTGKVYE